MKILHTSDCHIDKQLHKKDLSEDLDLFFNWMFNYIKEESDKNDTLKVFDVHMGNADVR